MEIALCRILTLLRASPLHFYAVSDTPTIPTSVHGGMRLESTHMIICRLIKSTI